MITPTLSNEGRSFFMPAQRESDYAGSMVILGRRGKSKIEGWLLGSVSKRVATYAPCTVTIVK